MSTIVMRTTAQVPPHDSAKVALRCAKLWESFFITFGLRHDPWIVNRYSAESF